MLPLKKGELLHARVRDSLAALEMTKPLQIKRNYLKRDPYNMICMPCCLFLALRRVIFFCLWKNLFPRLCVRIEL